MNQNPQANQSDVVRIATHYEGIIPPPEVLRGFENTVAGSADRIIKLAETETLHRRECELKALDANIYAQNQQLIINQQQNKSVFKSDWIGQSYGFLICILCVAGAVYLATIDKTSVALALTAMPTAALIKEFFIKKK